MATTSVPRRWKYDVFVSFRGEDIRKSFMDHLFNDFKQKGIHAFSDDRELPKGEEISPQLYKAIEESRFLIVIFSKNYASSSWCLQELVKILECKQIEDPKHEVRTIFYDAKPDVVRKQKRSYAKAFARHELSNRTEVDKWREALSTAANLSGWDLQDMTNGYEYKFIDCISKDVLKKISDGLLHVGENLVGIDIHFDKLDLSRFAGSDKVNMIGICEVEKRQGLTQVQMQMIGKILKTEDLKISSVGEGTVLIKQRMACKRILLVLDNVNSVEQLEALAGSPDWFYPGSLIIFTGKDKQLLRSHKVDVIYDMKTLNDCKALELFSLYAFGKRHPTEDFEVFASQIVKYLQGHPLALKVFGRLLYDKSLYVWKSELARLQTYPNSEIVQKLRPSFDGLASDQKEMFLDIACAFIGENKDYVSSVLDRSHCSANAIIEVLADKCLITVYAYCLQMHELIQSMAREIIREEFAHNHRRLWISSEDYDVPNVNKVTEEVEVLVLLLKKNCQNIPIDGQALTRMKNLRILKICFPKVEGCCLPFAVNIYGRLDSLSNKLRLLYWHGLPLKFLPLDFYPENIVTIDLSYSNIKHLWTTPKCFRRLKFMKLRYCLYLTSTPDFTDIANLEELILEGCKNLVKVHPSIGMLKKLLVLNMRDCACLKSFPSNLEMDSLQILILSGCLKLRKLPEDLGRIKSLTKLHIDRTSIIELPLFGQQESIRSRWWTSISAPFGLPLKQHPQRSLSLAGFHMLKSLIFSFCNLVQVPESIEGLSCLEYLNLEGNNILEVPESIGGLSFLAYLNLEGNNFTSLPGSLSQLSHLLDLCVDGCKRLEVLPELPPSLYNVRASDCTSLCSITGSSKDPFMIKKSNYLLNCPKLFMNLAIDSQLSKSKTQCLDSSITSQGSTNRFSSFLQYTGILNDQCEEFHFPGSSIEKMDIINHGNSIPEWFTNKSMGNHVKIYWTLLYRELVELSLGHYFPDYRFEGKPVRIDESYMIWLHYTQNTRKWKEAKNFVTFCFEEDNEDIQVKDFGVRLIYDGDLQQDVTNLNMLQDLPTLSQHGGALCLYGLHGDVIQWSW
ncbi:NB-ARC domains-containing protein [Tanacetum coccineum]